MTSRKESISSGMSTPSSHDANFHLDTAPIASALCKFYTIRQVVMTGAIVSSLAFFAAWFATNITHLYISFAVAGIGFGFIYQPPMIILAYYFDKRLARALGIASAGIAIGNFALPPLFQVFINYYGWDGALLIVSGLVANAAMFGALYRVSPLELNAKSKSSKLHKRTKALKTETIKHVEVSSQDDQTDNINEFKNNQNGCYRFVAIILKSFDFHLLANIRFIPLLLANCLYGLAYVIILQYLPARAVDGGISEIKAAFLLSILGSVSVVVRFTHGYIIDYKILTARTLTALSFQLAAVACVFFPISDEYAILGILSALVGTASGVFNVTVPIVAKEYVGAKRVSGAVGFMLLATGAGVFVGLYLSGILYDNTGSYNLAFFLAGAAFFISSILLFIDPLLIRLLRGSKSSMPPVTMHLRKKSNSYEQVPQPTDLS
ncbi:monocarboxylate transporter 12-like [Amphiura filiformis]|uniref:monocarboxylate transporter 12-like n=1 Tax=Amphiura filiformis TaxID=82378 RepID=UPI003B215BBF